MADTVYYITNQSMILFKFKKHKIIPNFEEEANIKLVPALWIFCDLFVLASIIIEPLSTRPIDYKEKVQKKTGNFSTSTDIIDFK